jgi:hypothetical protein
MKYILVILTFLLYFALTTQLIYAQAVAIPGIVRVIQQITRHFPKNQIDDLARIAKETNGGKELGQVVGKLNLTEVQRADTFLRVAVQNGVLTAQHENEIRKMGNIDGLASLLLKVNSPNTNVVKGHIQELEIGICCTQRGGKVLSFGKRFNDGIKSAETDLDVLVEMNGKRFAIESKNYVDVPMDVLRADSHSLLSYCKNNDNTATPVFAIRNSLSDSNRQLLKNQFPTIFYLTGTPEEICTKIYVLAM